MHALRLLERGRGLIIGSVIDGRSDASMLNGVNSEVYDEFEWLRARLKELLAGSSTMVSASSPGRSDWVREQKAILRS